ncbi:Cytochrome P450, family 4, subfamily V, polypeptide 2 [Operophtera brumata]|uniref:Cytochrome P450, family 4, subfamily V, polypeptide 2 n=1 Tax=Operophtera brumata TaxID=104452 RepID=A0A0L7KJS1_OPEBR|nr:Cytochrome P450, family 4, subfamily V, polypeptide 2 [Operophtera brumata]
MLGQFTPPCSPPRPMEVGGGHGASSDALFSCSGSGKTFSMLSMKTTISHVVRRFRITADITKLVLKEDVLLKPASGQYIILEPRID